MTTLHGLNIGLLDLHERLTRELQFSIDAKRQIGVAMTTAREALDALDRAIASAFDERMRALSAAIGDGKPSPETVMATAIEAPADDYSEVERDPPAVKRKAA